MSILSTSGWIIKREPQIRIFEKFLDGLVAGNPKITIQEWYGVPGIGKTTLVRQLMEVAQQRGHPCALIDFHPLRNGQVPFYGKQPILFFEEILRDLTGASGVSVDFPDDLKSIHANIFESVEKAAKTFIEPTFCQSLGKPFVLFFDETERIPWEELPWLENPFIECLSRSGNCGIVWVGRNHKHWRDPGLREKQDDRELVRFEIPELEELEKLALPDGLDHFFALTQGHPMATAIAYSTIEKLQNGIDWATLEPLLMAKIGDEVIFGYILESLPDPARRVMPYLAVLRLLDPSFLKDFLRNRSSRYQSRQECVQLLAQIPGLSEYSDTRKAYCLKPTIRNLLLNHFRTQRPEEYIQTHADALQIYKQWMGYVNVWSQSILEALYHEVCILKMSSSFDRPSERLAQSLREYLGTHIQQEPDAGLRLQQSEWVAEALEYDQEILELVGWDGVEQLSAILRTWEELQCLN